jgi:DNA-binding transcriptional MerR regulator
MNLVTANELAPVLRVSEQTVRAWSRAGTIPAAVREGRVLLFDQALVLEALRRRAELARTVSQGKADMAFVIESCAGRRGKGKGGSR